MAKLSSLRGMQDARDKDMFHLSNSNYLRYNGHVQVSTGGKGGKKERKGCTKGKLEAVMRNSSFGASVISATNMTVSSMTNSHGNHFIRASPSVKPNQVDQDDPYTFTETEPQLTTYYPTASSSVTAKKPVSRNNVDSSAVRRSSTESNTNRRPSVEASSLARRVGIDPSTRRPVESPSKTPPKPRPVEPNSSKMNKLQAEFARNKVSSKRKKVDQPPTPKWEPTQKKVGKVLIANKKFPRKTTWQREKKARHELLERIEEEKAEWDSLNQDLFPLGVEVSDTEDESEDGKSIYERHWYSRNNGKESREDRISSTRAELRRELSQSMRGVSLANSSPTPLLKSVINAARVLPNSAAHLLDNEPPPLTTTAKYINKISKGGMFLLRGEKCSYWEGCNEQSLPCTRHCSKHIMYNVDQKLFNRCTAKSVDNTQCNIPVIDVTHHSPLCPLHAQQHKYNMIINDAKNKKNNKNKNRIVGISRFGKRSQKKKKKTSTNGNNTEDMELSQTLATLRPDMSNMEITSGYEDGHTTIHIPEPPEENHIIGPTQVQQHPRQTSLPTHLPPAVPPPPPPPVVPPSSLVEVPTIDGEVPEEVLEIASLDPVELAHQATRLLEEHDLTNVLNQIPPDAFNDLFAGFTTEDKNGGYVPTREETEELDRALEAVDNDVRSLEERMTHQLPSLLPLVDSFLDDPHLSFPTTDIQPSS